MDRKDRLLKSHHDYHVELMKSTATNIPIRAETERIRGIIPRVGWSLE